MVKFITCGKVHISLSYRPSFLEVPGSSSAASYVQRWALCSNHSAKCLWGGGSGREELKKQPPPSIAVLWIVNVRERNPDRQTNKKGKSSNIFFYTPFVNLPFFETFPTLLLSIKLPSSKCFLANLPLQTTLFLTSLSSSHST